MSSGLYSHTTRATGTVLTATIYNGDHQNHITNQNPLMTGGYSDNAAQMQTSTDPGTVGVESLATSLGGELERLRFVLKQLNGGPQWYPALLNTQGANVASAATLNLDNTTGDYVHVTGTTGITAITLGQGREKTVVFDGILTLTNSASLLLASGLNITTSAGYVAKFRGEAAGVVRQVTGSTISLTSLVQNSLGADVLLNNATLFFDGPSVAQGTVGTWYASGNVTLRDTAGNSTFRVKLWDGTTVIDSAVVFSFNGAEVTVHLSGALSAPAGNIKISVINTSGTTGIMTFNRSNTSKDCTLTAMRIS